GEARARGRSAAVEQGTDRRGIEDDGQHAVLEAVPEEDVREARRDERSDAMVVQRPRRVLTARAAPEVFPRKKHLGPEIPRLIQGEVRVQRPLAAILAGFTT